jgi:hypothetical protein
VLIVACVSGHGFGHGARVAALLGAVHRIEPKCRFLISTSLPQKFLAQAFAEIPHSHRECQWDVGVIQADALGSDPAATLEALEKLEPQLPAQIRNEAAAINARLKQGEPALVLGDVPPAAVLLAEKLQLPLVWQANFGWDSIYGELGGPLSVWGKRCNQLYKRGAALLRCPFSLEMEWGLPQHQIGLSAASPRFSDRELRQKLNWNWAKQKTALLSFGGLGFPCAAELLAKWPEWRFFVTDSELARAVNAQLVPAHLRPLDLMPLCSVVITKPGYSTFCEALSQGLGVVAVHRESFAEAEVLMQGLQRHGWHRLLSRAAFLAGDWQLNRPLLAPLVGSLASGGEVKAAQILLNLLHG